MKSKDVPVSFNSCHTHFAYYTSRRVAIALLRYGPYIPTAWVDVSREKKCVRQLLRIICRGDVCSRKNKSPLRLQGHTQRRRICTQTHNVMMRKHCHLSSIFFSQQRIHRQLYLWSDLFSDVVVFRVPIIRSSSGDSVSLIHVDKIRNDGWY